MKIIKEMCKFFCEHPYILYILLYFALITSQFTTNSTIFAPFEHHLNVSVYWVCLLLFVAGLAIEILRFVYVYVRLRPVSPVPNSIPGGGGRGGA